MCITVLEQRSLHAFSSFAMAGSNICSSQTLIWPSACYSTNHSQLSYYPNTRVWLVAETSTLARLTTTFTGLHCWKKCVLHVSSFIWGSRLHMKAIDMNKVCIWRIWWMISRMVFFRRWYAFLFSVLATGYDTQSLSFCCLFRRSTGQVNTGQWELIWFKGLIWTLKNEIKHTCLSSTDL